MTRFNPFPDSGKGNRPGIPRQPLGTVIFQKGLLTGEQLLEALDEGHRSRRRLGDILLERGWLGERELAETVAEQYGLPLIELEREVVDVAAAQLIRASDSDRLGAIAIRVDGGVPVVAVSDPSNTAALAELEALLGAPVHFAVATPSSVARALANVFSPGAEHEAFSRNDRASALDQFAAPGEDTSTEEAAGAGADEVALEPDAPSAPADDPGRDEPAEQTAEHAPDLPFAAAEGFADHAPVEEFAIEVAFESIGAGELDAEANDVPDQREERSDDFLWAPAAAPEPVPSEPAGAEAALAVASTPAPFEHVWAAADGAGPLLDSDPRSEPVAFTEPQPAPLPFGGDGRLEPLEALQLEPLEAAQDVDDVQAEVDAQGGNGTQADEAPVDDGAPGETAVSFVLVLRLSNGDVVELAGFDDRASASTRAAAVVEQLIADEPTGWTSIDGCHFRTQMVLAVDIVPAAL